MAQGQTQVTPHFPVSTKKQQAIVNFRALAYAVLEQDDLASGKNETVRCPGSFRVSVHATDSGQILSLELLGEGDT